MSPNPFDDNSSSVSELDNVDDGDTGLVPAGGVFQGADLMDSSRPEDKAPVIEIMLRGSIQTDLGPGLFQGRGLLGPRFCAVRRGRE